MSTFVDVTLHSASAERVGQGEVDGVTRRVTCTWWLLWLSVGNALVGTGWSNSYLVCTNRLRKHYSHLVESSFLAVKAFSAMDVCWPRMLTKQSSLMRRRG